MIGKHRDGGYAEHINVPGRNVFALPDEISFEQGAFMMCSSEIKIIDDVDLKPVRPYVCLVRYRADRRFFFGIFFWR
jgi:hypothetical protein